MRKLHDMARAIVLSKRLPDLGDVGMCFMFSNALSPSDASAYDYMASDASAYDYIASFSSAADCWYLGSETGWNQERLTFLLLLAETNPEDF